MNSIDKYGKNCTVFDLIREKARRAEVDRRCLISTHMFGLPSKMDHMYYEHSTDSVIIPIIKEKEKD